MLIHSWLGANQNHTLSLTYISVVSLPKPITRYATLESKALVTIHPSPVPESLTINVALHWFNKCLWTLSSQPSHLSPQYSVWMEFEGDGAETGEGGDGWNATLKLMDTLLYLLCQNQFMNILILILCVLFSFFYNVYILSIKIQAFN